MYDRNDGVRALISGLSPNQNIPVAWTPYKEKVDGPFFNVKTGQITHHKKNVAFDIDWWYLTAHTYPVFDPNKNNEYLGVMTPDGYYFPKEKFNSWYY